MVDPEQPHDGRVEIAGPLGAAPDRGSNAPRRGGETTVRAKVGSRPHRRSAPGIGGGAARIGTCQLRMGRRPDSIRILTGKHLNNSHAALCRGPPRSPRDIPRPGKAERRMRKVCKQGFARPFRKDSSARAVV
jgi:hypothetical protein